MNEWQIAGRRSPVAVLLLLVACGVSGPQTADSRQPPAPSRPRIVFPDGYVVQVELASDDATRQMLVDLGGRYAALDGFSESALEKTLRDLAAEKNVKAGALINGARVALTGQAVAPSLFAVMVALGKERTVKISSR